MLQLSYLAGDEMEPLSVQEQDRRQKFDQRLFENEVAAVVDDHCSMI